MASHVCETACGYMVQDPTTEQVDVDLPPIPIDPDVVDNGDGSSTIVVAGSRPQLESNFSENLSEVLPEDDLNRLAEKYLNLIDQDIESRKERDTQYADGLKRTGIAEPAPGGANFEGASRVTHPVLAESYVDFAASSMKELMPPNGPVRTKIDGKPNHNKLERATRKAEFMNWQLTNEVRGYRPELERLLTQLPAGGTQFFKVYWSADKGRIEAEFVPIDDFILPYNAKNFYDCQRKFHRMKVSPLDVERRISGKIWRDWNLPAASGANFTETDAEKQTAKIEGKNDTGYFEDNDRVTYEGCVYEQMDGDEQPCPYLITIDHENRKILGYYRNWDESDPKCQELDYIVDYNFIPWRGAYGIGLPQLIGGLSDALTGALRALLDSALIANSATAIKLKGTPSGSNNSIEITQATEIDAMGQDDIRKIAMPLPFPGPSPVLFQLLGWLDSAAKGVVSTAEEKIANASNDMPVGTALALIEQGAKVFSSIHARLHDSQRRVLEIIHRLNKEHLPDRVQFGSDPDDYVTREDFEGMMDVHPVSDPNIFSETQRFAQIQFILQMIGQLAQVQPQVYQTLGINIHALIKRGLEQMKFPDYEEILPDVPTAKPTNPCDENIALATGKPVKAFDGQDHQAHIQVHADFAQSPFLGLSPAMSPTFMTNCLNHIQDHLLTFYQELMKTDANLPNGEVQGESDNTPQASEALARASAPVAKAMQIAFGKIPQLMQMAVQHISSNAPKPPPDPRIALEAQKNQNAHQIATGKLQLDAQKVQGDQHKWAAEIQTKITDLQNDLNTKMHDSGLHAQTEVQTTDMKIRGELEKNAADNRTAESIAMLDAAVDHRKNVIGAVVDHTKHVIDANSVDKSDGE